MGGLTRFFLGDNIISPDRGSRNPDFVKEEVRFMEEAHKIDRHRYFPDILEKYQELVAKYKPGAGVAEIDPRVINRVNCLAKALYNYCSDRTNIHFTELFRAHKAITLIRNHFERKLAVDLQLGDVLNPQDGLSATFQRFRDEYNSIIESINENHLQKDPIATASVKKTLDIDMAVIGSLKNDIELHTPTREELLLTIKELFRITCLDLAGQTVADEEIDRRILLAA